LIIWCKERKISNKCNKKFAKEVSSLRDFTECALSAYRKLKLTVNKVSSLRDYWVSFAQKKENELICQATVKKYLTVQKEGKRAVRAY
jgi:hypothetical protein